MKLHKTPYYDRIAEILTRRGLIGRYDPRHIEAYIRCEYSTLDHLSKEKFYQEVTIGIQCIQEGGIDAAERAAQSFGL
jgi:hypothetical protein